MKENDISIKESDSCRLPWGDTTEGGLVDLAQDSREA